MIRSIISLCNREGRFQFYFRKILPLLRGYHPLRNIRNKFPTRHWYPIYDIEGILNFISQVRQESRDARPDREISNGGILNFRGKGERETERQSEAVASFLFHSNVSRANSRILSNVVPSLFFFLKIKSNRTLAFLKGFLLVKILDSHFESWVSTFFKRT